MDFTLGSIYSIFHLQLSISTLVTLFNRGPLKEDARTKNHDSWCPTSYHEQYLDSTTKNGRLNSSEMDGGTFLVWKILIHDEIQVTSSNICSPCSIVDIPFFSPQNPAAEAINIPWIMVFKHAFTIPTAGKWWSHSLPGEKSCNASQPHTTAGMMEPAIDWASWRSPSHKTHLPKTCPKIRKKHMTSTWVSVSPFVEETKINGSTHPISQKKRFRNTFLEFSWDSHHQKTPNFSQFPTTSSIGPNVTTSQCLRFPTLMNRMRSQRGGSQRLTTEIAWNNLNTCWFSGLLGDSQERFHNPILGYTILLLGLLY